MKITTGRLSDVAQQPSRADWSEMNARLKALTPGESLAIECPPGIPVPRLRSTILTNARRFPYGEWRLRTRTAGRTIHCFLIPA